MPRKVFIIYLLYIFNSIIIYFYKYLVAKNVRTLYLLETIIVCKIINSIKYAVKFATSKYNIGRFNIQVQQ